MKAIKIIPASRALRSQLRPAFRRTLRRGRAALFASLCLGSVNVASAGDLGGLLDLGQNQFETLVENVGAATHYKAIAPAEPLGILGFDLAVELSITDLNDGIFDIASEGDIDLSRFVVPRLHAHKGLPFGIDVGAFYTAIPDTDIQALGAELRYAILRGSTITPAVAVRVHYSEINGVDELDVDNLGLELTVSKGFLFLTPYGGAGIIRTSGSPNDVVGLSSVSTSQEKVFVGLNINLGFNFGVEIDRTGDYTTFSGKAGFRF